MSLIVPQLLVSSASQNNSFEGDKSPSNLSTLSSNTDQLCRKFSGLPSPSPSASHRVMRLQAGPSIDIPTYLSDDENDFEDDASARENFRFAPQVIRARLSRNSSCQLPTGYQRYFRPAKQKSDPLVIQAPPPGSMSVPAKQNGVLTSIVDNQDVMLTANTWKEMRGQTLLHLAARLGHDEIMRLLISETSQAGTLMNKKGQTPLLTAIEAGSISTATLLMDADPRSIIANDNNGSSVFHYACEHCNDTVLNRAIALSKRLNSTSDRITVSNKYKI